MIYFDIRYIVSINNTSGIDPYAKNLGFRVFALIQLFIDEYNIMVTTISYALDLVP